MYLKAGHCCQHIHFHLLYVFLHFQSFFNVDISEAALIGAYDAVCFTLQKQFHSQIAHLGGVPVLHGDVVCDRVLGGCIVSGDQIVPYLAKKLGAEKVGIVTATGGVLSGGEIIPEITRENVSAVKFETSDNADVTGGMQGKVEELLALAESGTPSHIIKPEMLKAFLAGTNAGGTLVK